MCLCYKILTSILKLGIDFVVIMELPLQLLIFGIASVELKMPSMLNVTFKHFHANNFFLSLSTNLWVHITKGWIKVNNNINSFDFRNRRCDMEKFYKWPMAQLRKSSTLQSTNDYPDHRLNYSCDLGSEINHWILHSHNTPKESVEL